jgi:hypothetical protein
LKAMVSKIAAAEKMGPFEMLLVSLETPPWDALYRIVIGLAILPVMPRLWDGNRSGWALAPFLIVVLLTLRVVPAVVRKFVPFSDTVQAVWAERRQVAKRWDSYQWQKLLWFGIGLALCTVLSGRYLTSRIVVCSICLVSGALGLARWQSVPSRIECAEQPAKQARDLARQL